MRKVLAFLVWLFSFWIWKDFFLCWLRRSLFHPANGEIVEHLPSQEEQQVSELAHFLSSSPEDGRLCYYLSFDGDSNVEIFLQGSHFTLFHGTNMQASYREFLEAVASSKILFRDFVYIGLDGDDSCKHVEAFADAYRQCGNRFKKLRLRCLNGSPMRLAKCVSSVLLGNEDIIDLQLFFIGLKGKMDKELAAKFMDIVAMPDNLRILKSFAMDAPNLDGEGMEQVLKPFQGFPSVLENLNFLSLTSDAQLEHISGMLASSTSLKTLSIWKSSNEVQKALTKGFKSIADALCTNQSLKFLHCKISKNKEMKVLLEPLMPRNNILQLNTSLTKLGLCRSIGGKKGIETLVDLIHTNTSLLELGLFDVDTLSLQDTQGVKNVLTILEALKTNKSLKKIDFLDCTAINGYKVLGAIMDLLLENHCIEDIGLNGTSLEESGDTYYISYALSKRTKMKLQNIVQSMAIVNPTSGRVFLCRQPFAGKTRL